MQGHGGVLASIADVALSTDCSGSAKVGDWIETSVDIQKRGSRLAFANAYFHANGERIARASGVFLVVESARR